MTKLSVDRALRKAKSHERNGQMDEAVKLYHSVLAVFPSNTRAKQGLAKLSQPKPGTLAGKNPSDETLNQLIALYNKGQIRTVTQECDRLTQEFPQSFLLWNLLGAANNAQGKLEEAIAAHNKALLIKPDFAEAHNNIGAAFQSQGKFEEASAAYNKALLIKPDYARAHYNLGITLQELGRLEEAVASYRKAIALIPDYVEAHYNLGNTLQELGRSKDAGASYRKAIALKPDDAEANYNLGLLLFAAKQYEKAAEQFKLSTFGKSKHYLLRCLYLQDEKSLFFDQLDCFINQGEIHPMIGSLGCRSALRYGIERPNLFCKDPLKYVLKTNLNNQYDFEKIFVKTARTILNENRIPDRRQALLTNGRQTSGNLFDLERDFTEEIQKVIRSEIEKYQVYFKDSEEGLITSWPTDYSLRGWLVSMKSGGKLRPHMHEGGWISGSIYINVPSKLKTESGNFVVCIEEEYLTGENRNQEENIDVVTGSMCLFPASLLHYTIPFEAEEERIVLAFDVVPV